VSSLPEWTCVGRLVDELDLGRCFGQWASGLPVDFCFPILRFSDYARLPSISMRDAVCPFMKAAPLSDDDAYHTSDIELDASQCSTMI